MEKTLLNLKNGAMTREEEKTQAANNYGLNARLGYPRVMDETDELIHKAYIAGFDYADAHPRKGLVDIEKVCDFIYHYLPNWFNSEEKTKIVNEIRTNILKDK